MDEQIQDLAHQVDRLSVSPRPAFRHEGPTSEAACVMPHCSQESPLPLSSCPGPEAETVTVTMTMIQPALGTLGCRRESALRAQDQGPLSTGCCALVHKVLKMSFPEMHLVAKAELSHQEAARHLGVGAARHVLLQDLRCL